MLQVTLSRRSYHFRIVMIDIDFRGCQNVGINI